jgi:hypothetical protein
MLLRINRLAVAFPIFFGFILLSIVGCNAGAKSDTSSSQYYADSASYKVGYHREVNLALEARLNSIEKFTDARINDYYRSFGGLIVLILIFAGLSFMNLKTIAKGVAEKVFEKEKKVLKEVERNAKLNAEKIIEYRLSAERAHAEMTDAAAILRGRKMKNRRESEKGESQ